MTSKRFALVGLSLAVALLLTAGFVRAAGGGGGSYPDFERLRARVPREPAHFAQAASSEGPTTTFYALDFYTYRDYSLTAALRLTTAHAYFYVDEALSVPDESMAQVGAAFEHLYPVAVGTLGPITQDVDGQARVTVLLLDIRDAYSHDPNATTYVRGYFDPINEYPGYCWSTGCSNGREMIYLDAFPTAYTTTEGARAMAHDLAYLIHWGYDRDEYIWWYEAGAQLVPFLAGYGVETETVEAALRQPSVSLVHPNGTVTNTGLCTLMGLYLHEHFGDAGIRAAVASQGKSVEGVAAAVQTETVALFQGWALANYARAYTSISLPLSVPVEALTVPLAPPVSVQITGSVPGFAARYYRLSAPEEQRWGRLWLGGLQADEAAWVTGEEARFGFRGPLAGGNLHDGLLIVAPAWMPAGISMDVPYTCTAGVPWTANLPLVIRRR